jgi:hypothetical protein
MSFNPNTVYLSKSNHSNPDQVMKVREWLTQKGFAVIEHKGGEYDPTLLRKARMMIMVGCNKIENGFTPVGKGQYGQLRERVSHGLLQNYYVAGKIYGNIILRKVATHGTANTDNWTHNYGILRVKMESTIRVSTVHDPEPERNPDDEPVTKVTDKHTNQIVDRMEGELVEQLKQHIHLACITLFK